MSQDDVIRHLRANPAFADLGKRAMEALAFSMDVRSLDDGEVLFDVGDDADAAHLVLSGQVKAVAPRSEDDAFGVDEILGIGELAGLVGLVRGDQHGFRCTAKGPAKVARLTRDAYKLLVPGDAAISCSFQLALSRELVREARRRNDVLLHALGRA